MTGKLAVDADITLTPYFENYGETLRWYQDPELCRQVDNIDFVYDLDRLRDMYGWLIAHGECWYIEYRGRLVGDISLHGGEISVVICREYQNRHIGRRAVRRLLEYAREKGLSEVTAKIYDFNIRSQKMFLSCGFRCREGELYEYKFSDSEGTSMDITFIPGGVCAARGFRANGVRCGIKASSKKRDLALIVSEKRCAAAAVYTANLVKSAPIRVTSEHLADGYAQAVICNSGNANTCNANGIEIAEGMSRLVEQHTGLHRSYRPADEPDAHGKGHGGVGRGAG